MSGSSVKDPGLRGSVERHVCVLVVEDDPSLQRMILNYFAENNIRTLVASNGQEMVDHLASAEVNLVILDLRLGLEDGLDLLRKVRLSSEVPVIIITGHRLDDIDRVVGLELGADDYLTKPFNLRELLARVRAILRRFDAGRAAPPRPLSREHLLQATRVHEDVFDRSIDVQILRLRRKLERDPSAPRVIQTERGVGDVFAVPVERS